MEMKKIELINPDFNSEITSLILDLDDLRKKRLKLMF